ncbi:MAG TPA: hypothetical protein VH595_10865 [Verrucomicrobiae bacterium]|nr:hypothetical protein [Verrucomicrobiae bacterium]
MTETPSALLRRIRIVIGLVMVCLVVSGLTAFPLERELDMLVSARGLDQGTAPSADNGLNAWISTVRTG